MKKFMITGILAAMLLGLTACGKEEAATENELVNSISIFEDGSVQSVIVEDFTEEYYNVEELNQTIQDSITAFQKKSPSSVVMLESCEVIDTKVKVVLNYSDAEAYSKYNEEELFVGTILDAYEEGYDLNIILTGTDKDATKVSRRELLNMSENHIVIMENVLQEGTLQINCYDTILYAGDGVTPNGKKSADIAPADGNSVIVFK